MSEKYCGKSVTPFQYDNRWYLHLPLNSGGHEEKEYNDKKAAIRAANKHNEKHSTCYIEIPVE